MSTAIETAIEMIEQQVAVRQARCAIADDGCPDESSLYGTRDGYLNLTLALLRLVAESDRRGGTGWDDRVKNALHQLPISSAWLVGAYLFPSHGQYMSALSRLVDPQIEHPLLKDPQFADPAIEA